MFAALQGHRPINSLNTTIDTIIHTMVANRIKRDDTMVFNPDNTYMSIVPDANVPYGANPKEVMNFFEQPKNIYTTYIKAMKW